MFSSQDSVRVGGEPGGGDIPTPGVIAPLAGGRWLVEVKGFEIVFAEALLSCCGTF